MKIKAALLTFVLGCMAGGATSQLVAPSARAGGGDGWEYFCTEYDRDAFRDAGSKGWELVGGAKDDASFESRWCFKRRLP